MRRAFVLLMAALLLASGAGVVAADDEDERDDREGREDDSGDDGRDDDGDDRDEDDRRGRGDGDRKDGKDRKEKAERQKPERARSRDDGPRASSPPAPPPPPLPVGLTGDAALRQSVRAEPGRLSYLILVGGLGPGSAEDVRLAADLPDLGTRWALTGAGSADCAVLDGRLECAWGDLGPGDVRVLQASAGLLRAPAWQVKTVAALDAGNDRDPGNDAATTTVGILLT